MRQLVKIFQNEAYSLGLRARALTVIALSGSAGLDTLLRQYLVSPDSMCRQLAALACGMLRDAKAINDLTTLLKDPNLNVRRAASLGMVAIGHQSALEAVAEMLLQGDEDQRRAAAEALANEVEEGHPTLKEGSTLDDVRVRRAVVHGLRRIRHPWAVEKLQQMQVSDSQWVVKDAATQVLEEKAQADPRLPKLMPEITETPWLIGFAGERGVGVSPGKPALDLVLLALNEGKEEQRLAALDYLTRFPEVIAISTILEVYSKQHGETREAAFSTLWHYAAAGVYQTNVETHLGKVG
jgi:HEAT repeat protein